VTLGTLRGDYESAEHHAERALELLRRAKYPWSGAALLTALACARATRDDASGANQAIDLMLEPGLLFQDPQPLEAFAQPYRKLIQLYSGEKLSGDDLENIPTIEITKSGFDFSILPFLCAWVEIGQAVDSTRVSDGLIAALTLANERGIAFCPAWPFLIPRLLGVASSERGCAAAERHFERALGLAQGIGAISELVRTQIDYADMLSRRNQAEDHRRAFELIERALAEAESCCPRAIRARAERLRTTLKGNGS
jgi:hypothetical protein